MSRVNGRIRGALRHAEFGIRGIQYPEYVFFFFLDYSCLCIKPTLYDPSRKHSYHTCALLVHNENEGILSLLLELYHLRQNVFHRLRVLFFLTDMKCASSTVSSPV